MVDSAADICGALQSVLALTPEIQVSDAHLRGYIGRHLIDLFQDLFPGQTLGQTDELIAAYRKIYLAREHTATTVYPGVKEALASLSGRKSTATTKGTPTTRNVLELFGLLKHFDHVQGTDGFPAKPAPDVVLHALQALHAQPTDCLFVGDSPADMEAGRLAGVQTCAVQYGYGQREQLAAHTPNFWINDLRQLLPPA